MKLAWFSPLPPARSGIADYTRDLLPDLAEVVDVELWTEQSEWDPALGQYARVSRFNPWQPQWERISRADMSIFHLGNHGGFHSGILMMARQHPGVVVAHDVVLHHLIAGTYVSGGRPEEYVEAMRLQYGREGYAAAHRFLSREVEVDELTERFPLTGYATERAAGVLTHGRPGSGVLEVPEGLPSARVELPWRPRRQVHRSPARRAPVGGKMRLIVFGHLGLNRCLEESLLALHGLDELERGRLRLDLYGEILDEERVLRRIGELGLEHLVGVHGFVGDDTLDEALASSHLAINLRHPTMGEGSVSQLRIWEHALPSLVSPAGWYRSLPAEVVRFVRPERAVEDLKEHFRALLAHPADFARQGEAGRRRLEAEHSSKRYVVELLRLARQAMHCRAVLPAAMLDERVRTETDHWCRPARVGAPRTLEVQTREILQMFALARQAQDEEDDRLRTAIRETAATGDPSSR